jgi:predicted negative regulator of RcsB-dependent stress response
VETEDQQVERIKEFWDEHGKGIIAGLVIGFAIFYGWRYYDAKVLADKEAMSDQFTQVMTALASDNDTATVDAQAFLQANSSNTYAHLAALELARKAVEAGDLATAVSALQSVRDNAKGALKAVADVRQARVLNAQGQHDAALAAIASTNSVEGFNVLVLELRGDILLAKGDSAGARAAYQAAIDADAQASSLAEIKLKSIPAES